MTPPERKQRIRLFISCLVDNFFPQVGEAMLRVLSGMGLEIEFPQEQTCCGQPAFNSGHAKEAEKVACHFLDVFGDGD
ncbi:MAG: (Fe-S)-binding protein, partial [Candidatus Dadabacteria bacterium]|nr:(Fe-S)-binding protein [Candidatus Dadabacteria bacterium]